MRCGLLANIRSAFDLRGAEGEATGTQTGRRSRPTPPDRTSPKAPTYLPLIVPIILFITSLYIPPGVGYDAGEGFRVLQNMLKGGAFNTFTVPDPANIAQDVIIFQTYWSPGQYLVPGSFIWLGSNHGLALSLTALIGVVGWIQVVRSFGVTPFVLSILVLGLCTFSYVTLSFQTYNGGELLLFRGGAVVAQPPPALA